MQDFEELLRYLTYLSKEMHLDFVIKYFAGFANKKLDLTKTLLPFGIHSNPFCMGIKSSRRLWDNCIAMRRHLFHLCQKSPQLPIYYGRCFCGLEEYIVPIRCGAYTVGAICVGQYCCDEAASLRRLEHVCTRYGMDRAALTDAFRQATAGPKLSEDAVLALFGIAAKSIAGLYEAHFSTSSFAASWKQADCGEAYLLSHAMEYIRLNYAQPVRVKELAAFCHCSESYINHLFKRNTGVSVSAYTNRIRVQQAKKALRATEDTVAEIALRCGFSDPNYFSSVFHGAEGLTPTQYRSEYR